MVYVIPGRSGEAAEGKRIHTTPTVLLGSLPEPLAARRECHQSPSNKALEM
jgi:hypothetical protein